ncbi:MAG TPA: tetratricopeptide repeat protein [Candidatus Dormibacteraeota bacterium]
MSDESMGDRIRKRRMELGMSLAKVAGGDFSRAYLHQVELGKTQPSTRILRVVADRLGSRVEYLLDGSMPTLDREIALERARIALLQGRARDAVADLESAVDSKEWPLGADARLTMAEALLALGRRAQAEALLDKEEEAIKVRDDRTRLRRLRAIRAGRPFRPSAADWLAQAAKAVQEGRPNAALEFYRTARILLTGPAGRYRRAAGRRPGA